MLFRSKNELIIAQYKNLPRRKPGERLNEILGMFGLAELNERFFAPAPAAAAGEAVEQAPD